MLFLNGSVKGFVMGGVFNRFMVFDIGVMGEVGLEVIMLLKRLFSGKFGVEVEGMVFNLIVNIINKSSVVIDGYIVRVDKRLCEKVVDIILEDCVRGGFINWMLRGDKVFV